MVIQLVYKELQQQSVELQQQRVELQQQLASAHDKRRQAEERNKQEQADVEQLIKKVKDSVRTHGAIPAASTSLDTLYLIRKYAPDIFESSIDWSGATKVQESFINNVELPLYIQFTDENGEVLLLQTNRGDLTSHIFNTYVQHQKTPFLIGRVLYECRYNGKLIPLNVTIGSIVAAGDNNVIRVVIYVKRNLLNTKDFNNTVVPSISLLVKTTPVPSSVK